MDSEKRRGLCLVTGGALGDIPIILEAKSQGYRVITSGNRPFDIGHKFADEFVESDYTDERQIELICKNRSVDVLVSSCHDLAYIAAARVAEGLGYPGFDTPKNAEVVHSKNLLRKTLSDLRIATPKFAECNSLEAGFLALQNMRFPIIVKPVDLTGGNGISVCKDKTYFERAFIKAFSSSPKNLVIVEEYLDGKYHGFSTLIFQGKIVSHFLDDEYYIPNTFRVSATSFPSEIRLMQKERLIRDLQLIVDNLKLVDGLLHVQFLETLAGPLIIEIMRRTPGDLYPNFVQLATSVNFARSIFRPYTGEPYSSDDFIPEISISNAPYLILRYMLMARSRGFIQEFEVDEKELLTSSFFTRKVGDFVENPRMDTCAILFYSLPSSSQDANSLYNKVLTNSVVKVSTSI